MSVTPTDDFAETLAEALDLAADGVLVEPVSPEDRAVARSLRMTATTIRVIVAQAAENVWPWGEDPPDDR